VQTPREMIPARRVKILQSKYVEESDLIQWSLHFLDDGLEQMYVWPSVDLLTALNIKGTVTAAMIHKFCSDMQGKEINFVIDKEPELPEPLITVEENDRLQEDIRNIFKDEIEGTKEQ